MARRRARHPYAESPRTGEVGGLPGSQPQSGSPEPGRAFRRCQHALRVREQSPTGVVEIVKVMIVAQEHGVHGRERLRRDRRPDRLAQCVVRRRVRRAAGIEGRVGEEPRPREFQERGRPADVGDLQRSVAWSAHAAMTLFSHLYLVD